MDFIILDFNIFDVLWVRVNLKLHSKASQLRGVVTVRSVELLSLPDAGRQEVDWQFDNRTRIVRVPDLDNELVAYLHHG